MRCDTVQHMFFLPHGPTFKSCLRRYACVCSFARDLSLWWEYCIRESKVLVAWRSLAMGWAGLRDIVVAVWQQNPAHRCFASKSNKGRPRMLSNWRYRFRENHSFDQCIFVLSGPRHASWLQHSAAHRESLRPALVAREAMARQNWALWQQWQRLRHQQYPALVSRAAVVCAGVAVRCIASFTNMPDVRIAGALFSYSTISPDSLSDMSACFKHFCYLKIVSGRCFK